MSFESDVYVCGHTKKCGWKGFNRELIQVPDVKFNKQHNIKSTRGTCPKCGCGEFYIRPRCGDKIEIPNGETVTACHLDKGHKGAHQGWCLGSRCNF